MNLENTEGSSFADGQEAQTIDTKTDAEDFSQISTNSQGERAEIQENDADQNLYNEILEKLDIVKKENTQDIQGQSVNEQTNQEVYLNEIQKLERPQSQTQIETVIAQDLDKIQKLMQLGLINSNQGQDLKKQVLQKAFDDLVQAEKIKRTSSQLPKASEQISLTNKNEIFEEFSKSNPDFFTSDGRKEVLNYLKSGDVVLGKDELSKISDIIRTVEKAAIDRYLQKVSHEKTLRDSNETAKQRLTANAQKSGFNGSFSRTFTREQIGKMSSAEFVKYESAIMEQLKKGLIR